MFTRRHVLASALAAPAILRFGTGTAQAATTLKISHQFPGGTIDKGDFRDRLCRVFAAEVAKRSGGEIAAEVYPNSSLIKTNAQFSAMRKGALDISLYPLPYAGGELPETNIGLMPGLVSTYDQGMSWKKQPVGKALTDFLADKGIIILSWVWQAGGVASRSRPIVAPEDAKGLKVRGGSREMDMVLQTAGAAVLSVPSNELYAAMQTGACDAGITSSTSLISFRLEEVAKSLTSGAGASYWFMLEPLLMSKSIFDGCRKTSRTSFSPSAPSWKPSAGRVRRTTISKLRKSTKRPAPRSARSTQHRRQMARHRPRYRMEGLWREDRDVCQPAETRDRRLRMMHGPLPDQTGPSTAATGNGLVAALERGLAVCNNIIVVIASIALIAACAILSYSVLGRALFHSPNYWQDEAAVFLLVGATFMTSAYVQQQRGHIGIEAFVGLLSPTANRIRLWLVDVASLLFCAFFAWKSWTLAHEAWVDGQVSNSMWSPPLAIPYGLMASGMTLLCVQILLQIIIPICGTARR